MDDKTIHFYYKQKSKTVGLAFIDSRII